jgi:glycosyltransferase involved in cell wall biosynthesis
MDKAGHRIAGDSLMHVVLVIYLYEPDLETPQMLLHRYSTIGPIAHALHNEGAEVTVLQRFHRNVSVEDKGVRFEFCVDACDANLRKWQIPHAFHRAVRNSCARQASKSLVVHVHGLLYPLQTRFLRNALPFERAMVAQHHAEKPWNGIRRPLQKWGLRSVNGFFFAAPALAEGWIHEGLISKEQQIFEVMEGSTFFRCEDRTVARARTGLSGAPVILWVGNLTANKDPLTVLSGFEQILRQVPLARLYMAYRSTDLLGAVQERIAASSSLREAVKLLGNVDHPKLEDIYNSADYFTLGSHYEGSGFALAEAMACGVIPVVTRIPSFMAMTDEGRAGACWTAGDPDAFSRALLHLLQQPIEALSKQVRRIFDQRLSYPAIARASLRAYDELTSKTMVRSVRAPSSRR